MIDQSTETTMTPLLAATHLGIDYTTFVRFWWPRYREFLSAQAQAADPRLTADDLALLQEVKDYRALRYTHKAIRRVLKALRQPAMQERVKRTIIENEIRRNG